MSLQLYTAGARVIVSAMGRFNSPDGICTVVQALPREGTQAGRYRIKSDLEKFERIIEGSRLSEAPVA